MKAEREAAAPPAFEVLPANWLAVRVFLDCAGQWNCDAAGTPQAINRTWLHSTMQLWGVAVEQTADTFERLRVLESAASRIFRKRAKAARDKANRNTRR